MQRSCLKHPHYPQVDLMIYWQNLKRTFSPMQDFKRYHLEKQNLKTQTGLYLNSIRLIHLDKFRNYKAVHYSKLVFEWISDNFLPKEVVTLQASDYTLI